MHQSDHSLLEKMNIQTDAIVVNQCNKNHIEEFEYNGHHIKWISLNERGVGLSRNTALMRADADILLFADDDVVYADGYEQRVLNAFLHHNHSSLVVFNLLSLNKARPEFIDKKTHALNIFNCLKYGACRIAVRREDIYKANVFFSLLFGGGARFQAGEDNLFITNCLQKGLTATASSVFIGTVKQESSTWFNGYDKTYYMDRGALFAAMYGKLAKPYLLLLELKNIKRKSEHSFRQRCFFGYEGIKNFNKLK